MSIQYFIKINTSILFLLILSILASNAVVVAIEGNLVHGDEKIDVFEGYSSTLKILMWKEQVIFEFEITEASNYTFEIFNINASLTYFSFNHKLETGLSLLDGGDGAAVVTEGQTVNDDNLPVGAHVELDVLRYLKITEVGNYTLTIDNTHEHPADAVKFEFKFSLGLNGEEKFGTMVSEVEETPGFGFTSSLATLFIAVFGIRKFHKKNTLLDCVSGEN